MSKELPVEDGNNIRMLTDEVRKEDSATRLAAFLSDLRKDLGGISQRQLSDRLGVSATTCQSWEAGSAKPGLAYLVC